MPRDPTKLRALPSVDRLLRTASASRLSKRYARAYLVETIRAEVAALRAHGEEKTPPGLNAIMDRVERRMAKGSTVRLRRVVNASGVILHTNLGRAELARSAVEALMAATGAVGLEYDLASGKRGDRDDLIEADLRALTGAEAATAVNNNAAAVVLTLNTLAQGREVIVSRGELVEIGGSFRIPDILGKSGARLREVGTTNRTHRRDYEEAIGPETAVLLKVHTSNYRIVGFTAEVALQELVELGRAHHLPVVEDLGSGALLDLSAYGLPHEPVVRDRIALGADVVTFSGDKLLGGPQCGLITGRRATVDAIKSNPLKRALRCDKLTLAALSATLGLYRHAPELRTELPTLRWLTRSVDEIESVACEAAAILRERLGSEFSVEIEGSRSQIGSGALPTETLETRVVAIAHPRLGADEIAALFRGAHPPVIGRIENGRFLLDLRAIGSASELSVELPQRRRETPEPQ